MTERKPPGVSFESFVDKQIREAERRGDFSALPGAGKPFAPGDDSTTYDENWWIKRKMAREGLSVLPPSLALRKEVEDTFAALPRTASEHTVRRVLTELNDKIRDMMFKPPPGPPLGLKPYDVDEAVRQWRIDREGRRLPVTGLTVRQVRVDHRLTFLLGEAAADDAHDAEALLVVAATARLEGAEGPAATLVPGEQLVAPALALFGTVTTSAVARPDGHLVLEFSDGTRLTVAPDPGLDGRAWSVTDPRGNPLT